MSMLLQEAADSGSVPYVIAVPDTDADSRSKRDGAYCLQDCSKSCPMEARPVIFPASKVTSRLPQMMKRYVTAETCLSIL